MVRKERLISMLFAVILTIGTIAGSVHAAEAPGDGHNSEIEESKYRIVLDANGGYVENVEISFDYYSDLILPDAHRDGYYKHFFACFFQQFI